VHIRGVQLVKVNRLNTESAKRSVQGAMEMTPGKADIIDIGAAESSLGCQNDSIRNLTGS